MREWKDVAAEAKRKNIKAHVGRIFDLCVEKGSELPPDHLGRKFKGRVVFQGNQVMDENWDPAIFQEDGRTYLLYAVAGEAGIGIAELEIR